MLDNFTFGTDPEFIVYKKDAVRLPASMITVLPPKDRPIEKEGYKIYHDNMLAEITVPPATTTENAIKNIHRGLHLLDGEINRETENRYYVSGRCAEKYPESEANCEEARTSGCVPELDAYDLKQHAPDPELFRNSTLRTAGGHIHLGHPIIKQVGYLPIVHALDVLLGAPLLGVADIVQEQKRRTFYGGAGRFRITPYGLEYRTLSNNWLFNKNKIAFVFDMCENIVEYFARVDWPCNPRYGYYANRLQEFTTDIYDEDIADDLNPNYYFSQSITKNNYWLTSLKTCKCLGPSEVRELYKPGVFFEQHNRDYWRYYESICSST